jgi:hypothetical protein
MDATRQNPVSSEIQRLGDRELLARFEAGTYAEWAVPTVKQELERRGVRYREPVESQAFEAAVPFRKQHPILFVIFLLFVVGLIRLLVKVFFGA